MEGDECDLDFVAFSIEKVFVHLFSIFAATSLKPHPPAPAPLIARFCPSEEARQHLS